MANVLYTLGKQNMLDGQFDLNTDEMRVVLTDHANDTPNVSTDDAYDDISAGTVVNGMSNALDTPTITNGVFDADPETIASVGGDQVDSLTIYKHNATPALALLLVYIDVDSGGNLPFTPTGGDVTISWHGSGIFAL